MKKRVTVKSGRLILIGVALLLCAAIAKLIYVAVSPKVDGINLKKFAESRNEKTKVLYASRGTIYDSTGEALALSVNSYTLIAYLSPSRTTDESKPQHVVDKEYTAKMLSPILGISEEDIISYLSKEGVYQVEFGTKGKNLTEGTKKKIENLELPGIDFMEGTQRYYKMGNFAPYIVGYAKTNEDGEIKGELGVESYYDEVLAGKDGYITYQSDAHGYQLPDKPYREEKAESGSDIYLTIDSNIQLIVENAIKDLDDNFNFEFALMTVMDAKTGAIVASATNPNYNPNDLNTLESYLNPLISYTFEPGSTMKIYSWLAAMEEGIYDGEKTYHSGSIDVADVTISDWNKVGWGDITYDKGFMMSSNVGATNLALDLGTAKLTDYYYKFGFGKKTGIELSGEVEGLVDFTYQSELATASFGQGKVTITPIQMLQALTMMTNDGVMLKPYIVDKIVDDEGNVTLQNKKMELGQIITKENAAHMRELMWGSAYTGVSKWWQPETVTMISKTGTAQISSPNGGYLDGKYDNIYSLAGIFPDDNPRYIIYVAVKKIEGEQKDVANMTIKAVDKIASYANIATEVETNYQDNIVKLDNYKSQKVENVKADLESKGLEVILIGDGSYIIDQYPLKSTDVVKGTKVFLETNSYNIVMPNMTNWSLADCDTFASFVGMKVTYSGYGYIESQSLEAGTSITSESRLNVILKAKDAPAPEGPKPKDNPEN